MEKKLLSIVINDKQWYYGPENGYLYLDPSGRTGTFSLTVLNADERQQLNRQLESYQSNPSALPEDL
ncbi:MAG: hypothetical protein WC865_12465 [Bacteroidales bacterium]